MMNKKNILLSLFSILSIGCGQKSEFSIDPAFQNQYDYFLSEADKRGLDMRTDNLVIEFGEESHEVFKKLPKAIGVCTYKVKKSAINTIEQKTPYIIIRRKNWDRLASISKRDLILHELGHCQLDRDHETETNSLGYIKSLMYPSIFNYGSIYPYMTDYYVGELFNPDMPFTDPFTVVSGSSQQFSQVQAQKIYPTGPSKTYTMSVDGCDGHDHSHEENKELSQNEVENDSVN